MSDALHWVAYLAPTLMIMTGITLVALALGLATIRGQDQHKEEQDAPFD